MSSSPSSPSDPALPELIEPPETPPGATRVAARPPGRLRGFRALRWPGFRIYFVGMLLRGTAMWMPLVAVPWLAVELGASPAEVGIISAFLFVPTLFIGPMGGVLADRVERRRVLILTQVLASIVAAVVSVVVLAEAQTLPLLALASFSFGTLIAVEVPVRQAFMTELVPSTDISSAASLHATAWNTTRLFGPVVAGVLIASVGSASPFLLTTVISLGVAWSIKWMDRHREAGRQRADRSHSVVADLREGAGFARREPAVRWSLILIWAAAMFGIATFMTLAPIYAPTELGLAADGYGAFVGASGAGALVSALLVTTFAHGDRRRWLVLGAFAMAALVAGLALVELIVAAFLLAFFLGAAQIVLAQNALVSVQATTPDMLRGRVMGIWVMVFQGSSLFGAILSGWLAEVIGVRGAMLASALALAAVACVAAVALRRVTWRVAPARLANV